MQTPNRRRKHRLAGICGRRRRDALANPALKPGHHSRQIYRIDWTPKDASNAVKGAFYGNSSQTLRGMTTVSRTLGDIDSIRSSNRRIHHESFGSRAAAGMPAYAPDRWTMVLMKARAEAAATPPTETVAALAFKSLAVAFGWQISRSFRPRLH